MSESKERMKKNIWFVAAVIGVVNAIVLYVFELIGVEGTNWLWNDVLHTDEHRWLVIPVAIVLGLFFTAIIKACKSARIVSPENDLLAEMDDAPSTVHAIGVVLAIGAAGLLAGGSIGPEASLVTASSGVGAYFTKRWKFDETRKLLILASIGALLVAFIDTMVLALVPLLILLQQAKQQKKRLQLKPVVVVLLASLASYITLHGIHYLVGESSEKSVVPALPAFQAKDFLVAILLGFVSGFLALSLTWLIDQFWHFGIWLDGRKLPAHDWLVGIVFSSVLGVLYLLGGRTIQFSGDIGTHLLVGSAAQYGALALAGFVLTKLLATAWSKGTGYRGGLVFPAIYVGAALGLLAGQLVGGLSGAGALVGGISGMLTAGIGSPIMAAVFLIAVLPTRLWPVGVCAIIGTMLFTRVTKRIASVR